MKQSNEVIYRDIIDLIKEQMSDPSITLEQLCILDMNLAKIKKLIEELQ